MSRIKTNINTRIRIDRNMHRASLLSRPLVLYYIAITVAISHAIFSCMKLIKNQGRISSNGGKTSRFVKMYLHYSNKFTLRGEREKEREKEEIRGWKYYIN